ncbi:MAG: hypothetical protein J6V44_01685 [Methanobrevibacter sp.]|nr:hypothetical protein [Methanobrevibacter sp.]
MFADSKVGTVSAVTSNGFMVGPNFTDISNALRYITGININASAHLIVDLSDHTQIDAGLIREITSFEIDASAHLIAYYNDGSSDDLGALNLYESIRDQNGHLRFVEDDGNPSDIAGLTSAFCKWSLSGSHLMMVFAGSIANGSEIAGQSNLSAFTLPSWIADKIYPVFANIIELKEVTFYGDDYTTETKNVFVLKSGNDIIFRYASSLPYSLTKDRHFRIVCDLLIDND